MGCGRSRPKDAQQATAALAVEEVSPEELARWRDGKDKTSKGDKSGKSDTGDKPGKPDKSERSDKPAKSEKADRPDRRDKDKKSGKDRKEAKEGKPEKKKKKHTKGDSSSEEEPEGELTEKQQRKKAKKMVTNFTKDMVRGRHINVLEASGEVSKVLVSLARTLDALKIKAGEEARRIELTDVREIQVGEDVAGIDIPVDELCATLKLADGEALCFKLKDMESRDTFVMCLLMFCQQAQGDDAEEEEEEEAEVDEPVDGRV